MKKNQNRKHRKIYGLKINKWKIIGMKIYINHKKCTGCGKCKAACPKGPRIYSIEEKKGKKICILKDSSYCLGCRMCVTVCLEDAIALEN